MHKADQTIVVRHKEFIGEITGSQDFVVKHTLNINPGLTDCFPWLSTVADRFSEYKLKGMVFHYIPSSGNAVSSTNAALGTVMIQTSYRAGDDPPLSKQEMLNEYWSSEAKPSEAFCHPIECDPRENPYNLHYVRNAALATGHDQLLYDMGTTWIATSGMQADDVVVGDLWVTYEVELRKPVMATSVSKPRALGGLQVAASSGSITGSTLFDGVQTTGGALEAYISYAGNTITIDAKLAGYFYIFVNVEAVTTFSAATSAATTTKTGCVDARIDAGTTLADRAVIGGGTPTLNRWFWSKAVYKAQTASTATIAIPAVTLTGAALMTNVAIIQSGSPIWP